MKGFSALATVAILTMKNIRPQQQFRLSLCFLCKLHLFLLAFVFFFLFHSLIYATGATVAASAESARYDKENDRGCRIKDLLIIKFPKGNEPWRIQHTSLTSRCL
jgi:hypothetical protein